MRRLGAAVALVLAVSAPVWAQTAGQRRRISSPVAFYDDAEPAPPGMLYVSEYLAYDRVKAGRDLAVPSTYFSLGLHRRFDVSGGVSVVRSQFDDIRINGVGDAYFGSKIVLLPEGRGRIALAVEPMLEVLGQASIQNNPLAPDRVNFILPLLAQKSFDYYRFYYTAGYFSRGILFHSLAWEWNQWSRFTPTVVLSHSRLTRELGLISEFGLNRSRSDVLAGAAIAMSSKWGVFANAGRSFGRMDPNSARYQVIAGVNFNFRLWGER